MQPKMAKGRNWCSLLTIKLYNILKKNRSQTRSVSLRALRYARNAHLQLHVEKIDIILCA
jgi:hypothetical protein